MSGAQPFPFWEKDWWGDPDLQRCSLASQMIWLGLIVRMMRKADGQLLVNGRRPTEREIAERLGCSEAEVVAALAELGQNDVYSRGDDGVIYCRKIARDAAKKRRKEEAPDQQPDLLSKEIGMLLDAGAKDALQRAQRAERNRRWRARRRNERDASETQNSVSRDANETLKASRETSRSVSRSVSQRSQPIEKAGAASRETQTPLPSFPFLSSESPSAASSPRPARSPATLTGGERAGSAPNRSADKSGAKPKQRTVEEQRMALAQFAAEEPAEVIDLARKRGGHP